ncbi:MAG: GTP-binding protein, partial [Myxococcaceae bacterium]
FLLSEGSLLALHQPVQRAAALQAAHAFGQRVMGEEVREEDNEDEVEDEDGSILLQLPRAPVVAVMGHVDHGKTSLLDRVRNTRVAQGEAGGITQGISAFQVQAAQGKTVTFIDTPGHAAFSQIRQRGASATDIVLLVVAADDGVMEQTRECIAAAARARCPIVVALNKVDKPEVDVARVKQELAAAGVLLEEMGGDAQCALVSARTGLGLDDLLDKLLLQAEIMQLRAVGDGGSFRGSVLECRVAKGRGVVASVLVQQGALRPGQFVVAGGAYGKVRALLDDRDLPLQLATPSMPVQVAFCALCCLRIHKIHT